MGTTEEQLQQDTPEEQLLQDFDVDSFNAAAAAAAAAADQSKENDKGKAVDEENPDPSPRRSPPHDSSESDDESDDEDESDSDDPVDYALMKSNRKLEKATPATGTPATGNPKKRSEASIAKNMKKRAENRIAIISQVEAKGKNVMEVDSQADARQEQLQRLVEGSKGGTDDPVFDPDTFLNTLQLEAKVRKSEKKLDGVEESFSEYFERVVELRLAFERKFTSPALSKLLKELIETFVTGPPVSNEKIDGETLVSLMSESLDAMVKLMNIPTEMIQLKKEIKALYALIDEKMDDERAALLEKFDKKNDKKRANRSGGEGSGAGGSSSKKSKKR